VWQCWSGAECSAAQHCTYHKPGWPAVWTRGVLRCLRRTAAWHQLFQCSPVSKARTPPATTVHPVCLLHRPPNQPPAPCVHDLAQACTSHTAPLGRPMTESPLSPSCITVEVQCRVLKAAGSEWQHGAPVTQVLACMQEMRVRCTGMPSWLSRGDIHLVLAHSCGCFQTHGDRTHATLEMDSQWPVRGLISLHDC
jgi:hypothetical protein